MYVPFCVLFHCVVLCIVCVNVYCTTATGCQPNCSYQIHHIPPTFPYRLPPNKFLFFLWKDNKIIVPLMLHPSSNLNILYAQQCFVNFCATGHECHDANSDHTVFGFPNSL